MKVITENSVYEFDDDGYVTRYAAGHELRKDGERVRVLNMEKPEIGKPMKMVLAGVADREDIVTVRTTSPVIGFRQ